ncbi:hypothetical protein GCM10029976_042490 [Kribbella albertanoniae]
MNHRDEQKKTCTVDPRPDARQSGSEFDQLLEASSLGAPAVLRHEAMTPDSFFVELDAVLDEDYARETKEQPSAQVPEGDVDDALLRLIERGAQPVDWPSSTDPNGVSSRPTWTYPSGSYSLGTCLLPDHETDFAGEQLIRLWYLPAAESRVVVSFVEYGRPSQVRALLAALQVTNNDPVPRSPESPVVTANSFEATWNLNLFSYLREDVARSMVSFGLADKVRFEPIIWACLAATTTVHISDEVELHLHLHSSRVSDDPAQTKWWNFFRCAPRTPPELVAGPTRLALERGRHQKRPRWRMSPPGAIRAPEAQILRDTALQLPAASGLDRVFRTLVVPTLGREAVKPLAAVVKADTSGVRNPRPEPSPDGMRRAELVDRAQAGDVGAFGELYDEYSLTVYRYIYARVSSSALAEDLTSETFVRALRALDSFRWQGRDFGAWLVTIARNLITDHYKSGRVRLEVVTDEIETHDRQTEGPEVDVLAAATAEVLRDAVASLPER